MRSDDELELVLSKFSPRLEEWLGGFPADYQEHERWSLDGPYKVKLLGIIVRFPSRRAKKNLMTKLLVGVEFTMKNRSVHQDYRLISLDRLADSFRVTYNTYGVNVRFVPEDVPKLQVAIDEAMEQRR